MDNSLNKTPVDAMRLEQTIPYGNGTPSPSKLLTDRKSVESGYLTNHGSASEATNSETADASAVVSPAPRLAQTVNVLNSHLGKRISVISRSDIRYEGMLQTVDQNSESAIINKVRFWGTETRPTETRFAPRDEIFEHVKFRLPELKDIFAHVEQAPEMQTDSSVVECSMAVYPILWSSQSQKEDYTSSFVVPDGAAFTDLGDNLTPEEWNAIVVDKDSAVTLLQQHVGSRNKISIISKALIRYEGMLRHLDVETHQISLVAVRFLGTEERPVVKKVDARTETYASVKFQLGEARDVRIYVKMSDDMANDHAVIVAESSLGAICVLKKRLPSLTNGNDAVQMDTVNGNVRLRMGALSPRQSGDGRSIVLAVPQGMLPISSPKKPTPGRRSKLFDSDLRKSGQKPQPADDYNFKGEEEEEEAEEEEGTDDEEGEEQQVGTLNSRRGRARGSGRGRGASSAKRGRGSRSKSGGRQPPKRSQKREQLDVPSASKESGSEGSSVAKVKKMQLDALISNTMGKSVAIPAGKPKLNHGYVSILKEGSHSPAVYPDGNGDKMGEDVSSEEGAGNESKGPLQEMPVPWADANRKIGCPVQPCPDGYEARSMYNLKQHVEKNHPELNIRLVLQCGACNETIQSNSLPDLKHHQTRAHGHPNGETNGQATDEKDE